MEAQLADYRLLSFAQNLKNRFLRQVLTNSNDSGKLVAMASKVEQLREQLRESDDRYSTIHHRLIAYNKTKNGAHYEAILHK